MKETLKYGGVVQGGLLRRGTGYNKRGCLSFILAKTVYAFEGACMVAERSFWGSLIWDKKVW